MADLTCDVKHCLCNSCEHQILNTDDGCACKLGGGSICPDDVPTCRRPVREPHECGHGYLPRGASLREYVMKRLEYIGEPAIEEYIKRLEAER